MQLSQLVNQVVNPVVVEDVVGAKKVSPEKALAKVKASNKATVKKAHKVVSELNQLRAELHELSGAPCSPLMTIEQIKAKIADVKQPQPIAEVKAKVIPSKPQGIGAYCVEQLKAGSKPKDVLIGALIKFPTAKTSMACVYWYASKIKQGLL